MNFKTIALLSGVALLAGCPDGGVTDLPTETGAATDTDDTDVTPIPAFEWNVTLEDADNAADAGFDADRTITSTANSVANYPDIESYEFGLAQTEAGGGWLGEDCDGVVTNGEDICHDMAPDTTLTLTRVETIAEIVPGTSTLNNVDFPVENTPGVTFVIFGYNAANEVVECWAQGHNPAYYPNCDVYTPAM